MTPYGLALKIASQLKAQTELRARVSREDDRCVIYVKRKVKYGWHSIGYIYVTDDIEMAHRELRQHDEPHITSSGTETFAIYSLNSPHEGSVVSDLVRELFR